MTTTRRQRLGWGGTGLLLVLLLAGCPASGGGSETGDEPAEPPVTVPRPDATFTAELSASGSRLQVDYRLTNTGSQPLLVVDRVPVASGAGLRYRPDVAYVTAADQQEGVVLVSQRLFAPPADGTDAATEPTAGVTRLLPGRSLSGRPVVPLPLERRHPFDIAAGEVELPGPVEEVVFCLGVVAPPFPAALDLERLDGVQTVAHGLAGYQAQYQFCSEPYRLPG